MEKSLTWIKLCEQEWLLGCVNDRIPLSFKDKKEMSELGIKIQEESGLTTTTSYTWRSYRIWGNNELTEQNKSLVENILNKRNK